MTLNFLMWLQHVRLPLRIEIPEEIKHVSVLKATGLIEAEIHPRFEPGAPYLQPRMATVTCITDEGMSELHQWMGESWKRQRRA
jgi:hypothetical protein